MTITIRPSQISQFENANGAEFCLITNPSIIDKFNIEECGSYSGFKKIPYASEGTIARILNEEVPKKATC